MPVLTALMGLGVSSFLMKGGVQGRPAKAALSNRSGITQKKLWIKLWKKKLSQSP